MKALVFGAGKIARGFVGQLLELSGWETTFVDINRELVQALNEKGTYTVHILGDPSLKGSGKWNHKQAFRRRESVF